MAKMTQSVKIGNREIGEESPIYIIAEIGINHNGSLDIAEKLIQTAAESGCDAVKFQKRTPEVCVPENQKYIERETPWGVMTYLDYRNKVEFNQDQYRVLQKKAFELGVDFFASPWDVPSVDFLENLEVKVHKVASACLTNDNLLNRLKLTNKPIIMSTGMSEMFEVDSAVSKLDKDQLILMATTSTYPMPAEEANLKLIHTLKNRFNVPVGYSGHETGLQISLAAAALGAVTIERHITLDRSMWGSDHAASLEPTGLKTLVRDIRIIEKALGDGIKRVYPGEIAPMKKLRSF